MKTFLTDSPIVAAEFIKRGGVAAFPTETVYGLGANVFDETAIAKIFAAKKRPNDNPLIAHVAHQAQIADLVAEVTAAAAQFIESFFPAPLTLILRKSERVPLIATAGLNTIGVRMPRHAVAREFLRLCETPLVAPSANLSGKPSPTTWQAVMSDLDNSIDCILQGTQTEIGLESTVVDCTGEKPILLRAGAVSLEELQKVVPETELAADNSSNFNRSPGLRYKHYAPNARIFLISAIDEAPETANAAFIGLEKPARDFVKQKICLNVSAYAHSLFEFFRECDRAGIAVIYCQTVAEINLGRALMDRLKRAANG